MNQASSTHPHLTRFGGFVFSWHSGLQFARQPEQLAPAAPAETTDGARYQIIQF
ncbi:hypothetical protein ECTW10246_2569 [Escherichia coli TW10246]|nr:hypothetical protein ECDEC4A_2188 [Escherichia coli DEC4A]EIO58710.1 hypothetical protein ECTW10246_2569 [Escherichia coli TW10246]